MLEILLAQLLPPISRNSELSKRMFKSNLEYGYGADVNDVALIQDGRVRGGG
jgi:hypothetical protein